ncbi:hypothetical protein SAMN05421805_103273 [Saccharopolyspora antimicrobica]|uniref:Uncharacterized protein n=1 Tax=Saccharopolyspora antimicrobica TaxID=455193 RepID=A0A1I4X7T0_9PSEU|nr:hypothetical protein [Saccharopolyspora antimicrobica]RKT84346.1 hypothetical protein ATL45_2657 [Saccharopolyspora antimicrobica]SFN21496.1 hypothetical protein SAMN05421805_103273 [Saccharopolyspora antimicrobica]
MMVAEFLLGALSPRWRRARALRSAQVLDDVVDSQVASLPLLPADVRRRHADHLAELVLLAQNYRYYAKGWITRRELERRGRAALLRLEEPDGLDVGATHRR